MRLLPIVVVCALFAGCSGGDGDRAKRSGSAAPPLLVAHEERDFAPGALTSGDVVRCRADGLIAEVVVEQPRWRAFKRTTRAWEKDSSSAQLSLAYRAGGRIIASCSQ